MAPWLPVAIKAGASLVGGLFQRKENRSAAARDRDFAREQAAEDRAFQKEFAQHGVRWRTADARAAGIHPVYAMGASLPSASPAAVGVSGERAAPVGRAMAGMGQAIGGYLSRAEVRDQGRERHAAAIEESRTRSAANRAAAARDYVVAQREASGYARSRQPGTGLSPDGFAVEDLRRGNPAIPWKGPIRGLPEEPSELAMSGVYSFYRDHILKPRMRRYFRDLYLRKHPDRAKVFIERTAPYATRGAR